jgi:hypothetical protein
MRCHQSDEGIWIVMACFPLFWNVFIVVLGLPPATHAEFCAGGCVFSFLAAKIRPVCNDRYSPF